MAHLRLGRMVLVAGVVGEVLMSSPPKSQQGTAVGKGHRENDLR